MSKQNMPSHKYDKFNNSIIPALAFVERFKLVTLLPQTFDIFKLSKLGK